MTNEYIVKEINPAAFGRKELDIAETEMPGLMLLRTEFGEAKPLSIYVDTFGTGDVDSEKIEAAIVRVMDLTPRGIRSHL